MVTPPDETTADPYAVIAALRQRLAACSVERDTALAREAALSATLATHTAELTERKTEFDERIEHQAATIDVLRAMSASPGDAQPVFDLIVRRAQELCNGAVAALWEYDGQLVHFRRNPAAHRTGCAAGLQDTVSDGADAHYQLAPRSAAEADHSRPRYGR